MTAATAIDFSQFTVEIDDVGASYPAIQATNYEPKNLKEHVDLCLAESSMDLVSEEVSKELASLTESDVAIFDKEGTETTIFKLDEGVRFVVLGLPSICHFDKEANEILPRQKRDLKGTGIVTITRLPLLMVKLDGTLVMDGEEPQIFTLKLKSTKTTLVTGDRRDKEFKSLRDVQKGLQKHYGLKGRDACLHLASVKIIAQPQIFSNGSDSSVGIRYALDGAAKELPRELWPVTFSLMQNDEVMRLIKDPFNLEGSVNSPEAREANLQEKAETFEGEIPF
ncbi:MAG: hypothetical protein AAGD09_03395 [Cyanobacteria bacterium P01_F01_bin.56]